MRTHSCRLGGQVVQKAKLRTACVSGAPERLHDRPEHVRGGVEGHAGEGEARKSRFSGCVRVTECGSGEIEH